MIVSPGSSHPFRTSVVWHDIVVVRELDVTDRTYPVLFHDLPVQDLTHFSR